MGTSERVSSNEWPQWQKILFRFLCIYLVLQIGPWDWLAMVPYIGKPFGFVSQYVSIADRWAVHHANDHLFHIRPTLVPVNGSGDTSYAYTQFYLYLSIAALGAAIWTVVDWRRANYDRLAYWLRTLVRYYIAMFAISYGIIKVFALQMPFPTLSQMSTPLGDFLPMRFSWMFIGFSTKYQIFSGLAETVAGLLLLYRRTATIGLLIATGAFLNVVIINIAYDVPVKLFASHLLFACLFLLAWDAKRLFTFLVLNKAAGPSTVYDPEYRWGWLRIAGWVVKAALLYVILVPPTKRAWAGFQDRRHPPPTAFGRAIYDVKQYEVNRNVIPYTAEDTVRWKDIVFDSENSGSIGTTDPRYWQRYRRGYFRYAVDSTKKLLTVWRTSFRLDSTHAFTARYERPDTNTLRLWTKIDNDSLYVELVKSKRHFQLAERQFHWLSEYNR
jgi:hypothetical protein